MRWSSISIKKQMKQMQIFSTGSLEVVTISKQKKKTNLNLQVNANQIHKLKVRGHSARSCNPDMRKLRLIRSILKTSSQHVTIGLKAKICLPSKIVIPESLKEKATPSLNKKATQSLNEKATPSQNEKATPSLKEKVKLNLVSNSLKKVNRPKNNLKVKTSKKTSKDNNLEKNQQTKTKIHIQRQLLRLNNAQSTLGAQIFLNSLKRMDKKHA